MTLIYLRLVDPNIQNKDGETPLHIACRYKMTDAIKLLLQASADPNIKNENGDAPLHIACMYEFTDAIKMLLQAGANPNIKNLEGETPLYWACINKMTEGVKLLLQAGADPNIKDKYGESPLHKACMYKFTEGVKLLLQAGVDPDIKSNAGITPLYLACSPIAYSPVIIKYLILYGARETTMCTKKQTQSHISNLNKHVVRRQVKAMPPSGIRNAYEKHGKPPANRNLKNIPSNWYKILTFDKFNNSRVG